MFNPETGVPFPQRAATNSKGYTAAVRSLMPGQSVLLPITTAHAYSIVYYLHAGRERNREDFAVRKDGDGARIWRKSLKEVPSHA